ncbi:MAG: hypothetical protein AAB279_04190, partial [Candidatus Binatota bacterium]
PEGQGADAMDGLLGEVEAHLDPDVLDAAGPVRVVLGLGAWAGKGLAVGEGEVGAEVPEGAGQGVAAGHPRSLLGAKGRAL